MNINWLLHYPVWDLDVFGGGFLIALMATVHVYVAHFAVGGGLFLILTEMKGYRENAPEILDYTRSHSRFFLLMTMVFGAITGVGIWFVISVVSPAATSMLIHTFVFGFATEWVFFLGEIVCLFVYYYTFGKMDPKNHLRVGALYAVFAWLSLFLINGIITFMLTPGKWLETRNFWSGFFNPTFWPSLAFRTSMALMLAGLFGFVTSVFSKSETIRERMSRYCALWLIIPLCLVVESAWWYYQVLPISQKQMILGHNPEIVPFVRIFIWVSPILLILGALMTLRVSSRAKRGLAIGLICLGLVYLGAFEWIREAARRPWLIPGYMFSNGVLAKDAAAMKTAGILKTSRWVANPTISPGNQVEAGKEIFRLTCSQCHSVSGPVNDILPLTQKYQAFGLEALLTGMGKLNQYMPEFPGTSQEKTALAMYIAHELHAKAQSEVQVSVDPVGIEIPAFQSDVDSYILLAWTEQGMYSVAGNPRYIHLGPSHLRFHAQLIRRGESPQQVSEGVVIRYRVENGYDEEWIQMVYDGATGVFSSKPVLIRPFSSDQAYLPYPLIQIEALDSDSETRLISTTVIAPMSAEMGCNNCHGGNWRVDGVAGMADNTAMDIFRVHDRLSGTRLQKKAQDGNAVICQDCHVSQDTLSDASSREQLNLSAAIHGFHAVYLAEKQEDACVTCHPSGDAYVAGSLRGIHNEIGLTCVSCHGLMEDHALGLLKAEAEKGAARRLIQHISPRSVASRNDINPRKPWQNEPDCLFCHVDFQPPETDELDINHRTKTASQLFQARTDDTGLRCAACHGAPHAIYPATNRFGSDSIPAIQYQKNPYPIGSNKNCQVCHQQTMDEEIHHPNSLTHFRNVQ